MKLSCPKNAEHKEFLVTAHVTEAWVCNAGGGFIRAFEPDRFYRDVVHEPDEHDYWECAECHARAKVSA